jgi:LysR family transcriptional regulator, low CO2-responsive transcriptional regulator
VPNSSGMSRADAFPTARQLALIVAVAERGSATAAAAALGMSQPSVTSQLRAAQRALGAQLFSRTKTGLMPTPAGRAVIAYALRAEALRGSLLASIGKSKKTDGGSLAVGTVSAISAWLVDRLAAFRQTHSRVDIQLSFGNSADVLAKLERGAIDVALVGIYCRSRALECSKIGSERIVAVAASGSRYCRGVVSARAIADATFIVREPGSATRDAALACLAKVHVAPKRTMSLRGDIDAMRMAKGDLGIALVPHSATERLLDDGALGHVRIAGWKCVLPLYAARRARKRNPVVDAFWSLVTRR